jgi:hypothetical protein
MHAEEFLSYTVKSVAGEPYTSAEGLLSAHVADTLAISFDSDARWRVPQVSLGLEAEVNRSPATFDVRHACLCDHVPLHVRWASRRTISERELMPTDDRPLPNTKLSDQLVDGTWSGFYVAMSSLGPMKSAIGGEGISASGSSAAEKTGMRTLAGAMISSCKWTVSHFLVHLKWKAMSYERDNHY